MAKPVMFAQKSDAWQVRLRIMATTDVHLHLLPYDYFADQPSDTRGLARTATLIDQARAQAQNSILLDNGDFLNGTPMGDDIVQRAIQSDRPHPAEIHPMIAAMNALHYDAATLGNHDFDHGAAFLKGVIDTATFPHVLANLHPSGDNARFVPPYAILNRNLFDDSGVFRSLRIGIVGFVPPNSLRPRGPVLEALHVPDIIETAHRVVPQMRAQGVDIIVALAHSGLGEADHTPDMENAIIPLSKVPGIDVIIGGHAHQVFPGGTDTHGDQIDAERGTINGTPVVIPGFWGSHLGVVDLTLAGQETDPHPVHVHLNQVEARPIYDRDTSGVVTARVPSAPEVTQLITAQHDRTLAAVRRPVGETARPLHSFFSILTPSPAVQLVQLAQRDFVAAALAGGPHGSVPILSSASPFKCGGISGPDHYTNIPPGQISMRGLADLYLYANDLVALRITGSVLRTWLERAASVFRQIQPGQGEHLLIDPITPCYLFETVLGVSYHIDLEQPALFSPRGFPVKSRAGQYSSRVQNLCHAGTPVSDTDEFILVTNGFRASGGGHYPGVVDCPQAMHSGDCIRDILHGYVQANSVIDLDPQCHWHLSAPPGATALFDCAPAAASVLPNLASLGITPLDILASGFRRYRLTF